MKEFNGSYQEAFNFWPTLFEVNYIHSLNEFSIRILYIKSIFRELMQFKLFCRSSQNLNSFHIPKYKLMKNEDEI